ncbi:MAG: hypothetical protein VX432_05935, partial [Candidatus Poribacteria bacterium]|nr:hypothetical protein [Candidatus Poribacteria bacterium]
FYKSSFGTNQSSGNYFRYEFITSSSSCIGRADYIFSIDNRFLFCAISLAQAHQKCYVEDQF